MVNGTRVTIENFVRTAPGLDDRNPDHYGYCLNKECTGSSRVYYLFDEDVPANAGKHRDGTRGQRMKSACSKKCAEAKRKRQNELEQAPERKAKNKVYRQTSEVYKANLANTKEQVKFNRATKPGRWMFHSLLYLANHLLGGKQNLDGESPTFFERTGIRGSDFIAHIVAERAAKGIVGNGCVEHKIPQTHFDFNNPEDVRRCWMLSNITVLQTKSDNSTKMTKFEHTPEILGWPEHHFPTAWAKLYAHNTAHPGIPTEDEARVLLQHYAYGDPVD